MLVATSLATLFLSVHGPDRGVGELPPWSTRALRSDVPAWSVFPEPTPPTLVASLAPAPEPVRVEGPVPAAETFVFLWQAPEPVPWQVEESTWRLEAARGRVDSAALLVKRHLDRIEARLGLASHASTPRVGGFGPRHERELALALLARLRTWALKEEIQPPPLVASEPRPADAGDVERILALAHDTLTALLPGEVLEPGEGTDAAFARLLRLHARLDLLHPVGIEDVEALLQSSVEDAHALLRWTDPRGRYRVLPEESEGEAALGPIALRIHGLRSLLVHAEFETPSDASLLEVYLAAVLLLADGNRAKHGLGSVRPTPWVGSAPEESLLSALATCELLWGQLP